MALSPEHARGKLGATIPVKDVSAYQAFGVELIASFLLVLTMLASIDANKDAARRDYGTAAALGVVVTLCYLIAVSQNNDLKKKSCYFLNIECMGFCTFLACLCRIIRAIT